MTPQLNGAYQEPPINWPKVNIGGAVLTVRYNFGINYYLDNMGVDVRKAFEIFKPDRVFQTGDMALTLALFAAMVAENFPTGSEPKAEYFARQVKDVVTYQTIARAIAEALVKAMPAASPTPTQPAMDQTAPTITDLPQ